MAGSRLCIGGISVDAKKNELVGDFKNAGREYSPEHPDITEHIRDPGRDRDHVR